MYVLLVFATVITMPLIAGGKPPLRVIGGRDVQQADELTFVVRMELQIITKSDATEVATDEHVCTATVITPIRTLTAAHCITGLETHIKEILGKTPKQELETATKKFYGVIRYGSVHDTSLTENTVSRIIESVVHPAYKFKPWKAFMMNDVAICRTEPIKLATYGKVSTMNFASLMGQETTVVGYGLTNASDGRLDNTLALRKPLQILKMILKRCPKNSFVYPSICVARACGQSSTTCGGDSGGPVLHTSGILAINSAGVHRDCFVKGGTDRGFDMGLFTQLSPFIDWIHDQI